MEVLGDVVGRSRRSSADALRAPAVGRTYDYQRFCTTAWKVGNFLRHLGVRDGVGVAVADDPLPEPLLAFYGAASLGGVVRFGPPSDADDPPRALVVPAGDVADHAVGPTTKRVGYGDSPSDPSVAHFERDVWSENPTEPPERVRPDEPLLATADGTFAHAAVLEAAAWVVAEYDLDAASEVAVAATFVDPTVVVAGLVAPLLAGGCVVLVRDAAARHDADLTVGGEEQDLDRRAVRRVLSR